MKKAVIYFLGILILIGALAVFVTSGKDYGKELALYDVIMEFMETEEKLDADDVVWQYVKYLPPELHEKQYKYPFEQLDDMVEIEGENLPGRLAELLDSVKIYSREQEERIELTELWTTIHIKGQYRRQMEEHISRVEELSINLMVNKAKDTVTIELRNSYGSTSYVTYMLKTDNK